MRQDYGCTCFKTDICRSVDRYGLMDRYFQLQPLFWPKFLPTKQKNRIIILRLAVLRPSVAALRSTPIASHMYWVASTCCEPWRNPWVKCRCHAKIWGEWRWDVKTSVVEMWRCFMSDSGNAWRNGWEKGFESGSVYQFDDVHIDRLIFYQGRWIDIP